MIIKNKFGDIVNISLVTSIENNASLIDVFTYFNTRIQLENLSIGSEIPFILGKDKIIFKNIEVFSPSILFDIYMNIFKNYERRLLIDSLPKRKGF